MLRFEEYTDMCKSWKLEKYCSHCSQIWSCKYRERARLLIVQQDTKSWCFEIFIETPLSHRISMTSYLFSLLMVTARALHLTSLWSNHLHNSKSLIRHASPHLWNQLSTSIRIPHSWSKLFIPLSATFNWTCRSNLLHTAITFDHFSLLHSKLETYHFRKS